MISENHRKALSAVGLKLTRHTDQEAGALAHSAKENCNDAAHFQIIYVVN